MCSFLLNHNINISVVDPFSLSRFKEIYSASRRKDDRHDAFCIALMMQKKGGKITPINQSDSECEQLKSLLRIRERISRQRTRSLVTMRAVLSRYFPAFSGCFPRISDSALQLLRLFSNPLEFLRISEEEFLRRVAALKYFRLSRKKEIFGYFQKHIPDFSVEHSEIHALEVQILLEQIDVLARNLKTLDRKIHVIYTAHPLYKIISTLPACRESFTLGPTMLAELSSNREKFKNHRAFQSFAGTSPVTRQSGKIAHSVKMRRSCRRTLRNAMYLHAFCSLTCEPWARAYYDTLKSRGKSHSAALRGLSNKWAKILYAMWKHNKPYDPFVFSDRKIA
jgi:transposase